MVSTPENLGESSLARPDADAMMTGVLVTLVQTHDREEILAAIMYGAARLHLWPVFRARFPRSKAESGAFAGCGDGEPGARVLVKQC